MSENEEEPCALAYWNENKPTPILTGEAAERFLRLAEEAEEKAKNTTPEMIAQMERMTELYEKVKANSKLKLN